MKLKALHGFCLGGGVNVAPEEEFEAPSDYIARQWIASGAAVEVTQQAGPPIDWDAQAAKTEAPSTTRVADDDEGESGE